MFLFLQVFYLDAVKILFHNFLQFSPLPHLACSANKHHIQFSLFLLLQLFMYEALGLCPEGEGGHLIDSAVWVTNKQGKYNNKLMNFIN